MKRLILASNSPRRKEILEKFNYKFDIIAANCEEENPKNAKNDEEINTLIKKNCYRKAQTVANKIASQAIVIGADTVVTLDSVCILKPQNFNEAFLFLKRLSGREHVVKTAISLVETGSFRELTEVFETRVGFRELSETDILNYIEKFQPLDKAGSYGIQDFLTYDEASEMSKNEDFSSRASKTQGGEASSYEQAQSNTIPSESFVNKIEGSYYNVMGICPFALKEMLKKFS